MQNSRIRRVLGIAAAVLLAALGAQASSTSAWNKLTLATNNWDTAANWSPATVPNAIDDVARLTNTLTGFATIDLNVPITLGRLELKGDSLYSYIIRPGTAGSLRFETTSGDVQLVCFIPPYLADTTIPMMDIGANIEFTTNMVITTDMPNWYRFRLLPYYKANALRLSGIVSGNYPLRKTGPGMLYITNDLNSFSGTVTVAQGWLAAGTTGALGNAANTLVLGSKGHMGHLVMLGSSSGSRPLQLAGAGGALHWMSSAGVIGGTGTLVLGPGNKVYLNNATDNTYAGEAYVLGWSQVQTAAKVFTGDVKAQFSGYLQLTNAANVATKARLDGLRFGPGLFFQTTVKAMGDFLPELDTNSTWFLIDVATNQGATFNARLAAGAATLGNGYFFLGRVGNNGVTDTQYFTGASLQPNADGVYRLMTGYLETMELDRSGSTAGVLTGTNAVEIFSTPFGQGWFSGQVILKDANDFTGALTIWPLGNLQGDIQASGSPFGAATGPVALHSARWYIKALIAGQAVAKGATTFDGKSGLYLWGEGQLAKLTLQSFTRENRGQIWIHGQYGLGRADREQLLVTDNPPAVSNGIVAPYMHGTRNFLSYNAASGFTNAAFTKTTLVDATSTDIVNLVATETVPAGGVEVYALRATNFLAGAAGDNVKIGSGGLMLMGASTAATITNTAPIDFCASEGVVLPWNSHYMLSGALTGTNGLTFGNPNNDVLRLYLTADNSTSLFGRITVNLGMLCINSSNALGSPANQIYLNGPAHTYSTALYAGIAASNRISGVTLANTIELGPNGGAFKTTYNEGTLTLNGYITGSGALAFGGHLGTYVYINNSSNDYAGGTIVAGSGHVIMGANGRLGAGPVIVGGWDSVSTIGMLDILGSSNLAPSATLTVLRSYEMAPTDNGSWVRFQVTSATIGALQGSGNVELGTDAITCTLTTGVNNASTEFFGNITGFLRQLYLQRQNALVKVGTGTFTLWGEGLYTGYTTVRAGTMLVHGCIAGTAVVDGATAVLGGNGLVNDVVVTNGATLAADTLSAQSVTLYPGCHFAVTLSGAQAQTNYDQLLARSGTLTLGNSTLDITLGYAPTADTTFTIIKNESGNPVSGTFAGLPEGATVSAPYNGRVYVFRIRYNVGSGKDVVLQSLPTGTVFKFCMIAHPRRA